MQNLSLKTICEGLFRVRDNASALLNDAKLLRENNRISRSYALAYMACEESGKFSILYSAATQTSLGLVIDWKKIRKRFRSHDSKASQFMGIARAMPTILEAAATEQKRVDVDELLMKATIGVLFGPILFSKRNASVYCDFVKEKFTSPDDEINTLMADEMLRYAEQNIETANKLLCDSVDETMEKIAKGLSKERYDKFISMAAKATDQALAALGETDAPQKDTLR